MYAILVATAGTVVAAIATQFEQRGLVPERPPIGVSDFNRLLELDDRVGTINDTFLALAILTGIAFMVWMWRAAKNNEALGRSRARFGPGWAIGGWLIPVANLVIPVLIMQDLWRGADPSIPRGDSRWKIGDRSLLVGFWWGLLLFGRLMILVGNGRVDDPTTLDDLRGGIDLQIVGQLSTLAAAVVGVLVIRAITARQRECLLAQNEQWQQLSTDAPAPPSPPS